MTNIQLKAEIHKAIDNTPDHLLPNILNYINSIQQQSLEEIKLNEFIDKVFKEDDELLRRLAD